LPSRIGNSLVCLKTADSSSEDEEAALQLKQWSLKDPNIVGNNILAYTKQKLHEKDWEKLKSLHSVNEFYKTAAPPNSYVNDAVHHTLFKLSRRGAPNT
jgi:hypothetical protein